MDSSVVDKIIQENSSLKKELYHSENIINEQKAKLKKMQLQLAIHNLYNPQSKTVKRLYFSRWYARTEVLRNVEIVNQTHLELNVGLQYVNSKETYYHDMDSQHNKLKTILMMTMYFYKWKSRSLQRQLLDEQKQRNIEMKLLMNEFVSMREAIAKFGRYEEDLVEKSKVKGREVVDTIYSMLDRATDRMKAVP